MENYQLGKEEVVLKRAEIQLLPDGKKNGKQTKTQTELLLTNLNIVFIKRTKKIFKKEEVETEIYSLNEIKKYNEMPYLVRKSKLVEIYFETAETFLEFNDKKQAKEFFDAAMRVASGNSKFVRSVKKVKKEIDDTNKALNIDIVGATKKIADIASEAVIEMSNHPNATMKMKGMGIIAKVIKRKGKQQEQLELVESVEPKEELLQISCSEDEKE